jgi:hypothetical protein
MDELSKELHERIIDQLREAAILIDVEHHSTEALRRDRDFWRAAAVFRHWRRDRIEQVMPDTVSVVRELKELFAELGLIGGNAVDAASEARASVQELLDSLEAQTACRA